VTATSLSVHSEDEGRELCRKRGSEFKLPYPIIDVISGCDSPQTSFSSLVSSSTTDDKSATILRPVAVPRKSSATPKSGRKRKRENGDTLLNLYSTSADEVKTCNELVQQYQSGLVGEVYRNGNGYHYGEYPRRIQPMICRSGYEEADVIKMASNDFNDCRCYYTNGIYLFIYLFIYLLVHSFIHSFIHLFIYVLEILSAQSASATHSF